MDNEQQPTIAYPCPACPHGEGRARSVAFHDGQKVVHVVCDLCRHEWNDVSADTPLLFSGPSR